MRSDRLSPAMLVAVIALVLAVTGSATALPGKNSVDKNDIQKNAVKSKQVKNNSLKGKDIDESSLGKVPSATNADSATNATNATNAENANSVDGASIQRFSGNINSGGSASLFTLNGLTFTQTCPGGTNTVTATTSQADAIIHASGNVFGTALYREDDDFNSAFEVTDLDDASFASVDAGDSTNIEVFFASAANPSGVTVHLTTEQDDGPGSNDCFVSGYAVG